MSSINFTTTGQTVYVWQNSNSGNFYFEFASSPPLNTSTDGTQISWPVTIDGSGTNGNTNNIILASNLNIEDAGSNETFYFQLTNSTSYINFDGRNYTVVLNILSNQHFGGFVNVTSTSNTNVTVQNIGIVGGNITLSEYDGWIFSNAGSNTGIVNECSAINCYIIGEMRSSSGGIFGYGCSGCTATNCYGVGEIVNYSGGIFGPESSHCTAINCYSSGEILTSSGGIFGASASNCTTTNCYSVGSIDSTSGGIFGPSVSVSTATNCYTSGESTANSGGGIFADNGTDNPSGSYSGTNNFSEANLAGNGGNSGTWNSTNANSETNSNNGLTNVNTTPVTNPVWLNINPDSVGSTPFLLYGSIVNDTDYYYNNNFYTNVSSANIIENISTALTVSLPFIFPIGWYFNIISSNSSSVTINSVGQMTSATPATYSLYIIGGLSVENELFGYNTILFQLTVNPITTPQNLDVLFNLYNTSSRKQTANFARRRLNKLFK